MEFNVNQGNVEWIVKIMTEPLKAHPNFTLGEILLGMSEVLGRTIVGVSETPIQGLSMAQVVSEHMARTVSAGFTAKGYNMTGN